MPELQQSTPETLQQALAHGATILAATERAARDLSARFDQAQVALGRAAWQPAHVYSWNTWLQSQWSALITAGVEHRLLLNPAQEHTLWREILSASTDPVPPGSLASSLDSALDSLAELAQTAWALAANYEATADLRRFAITHDSRVFAAWAAAFARRCQQRDYVSAAQLPAALLDHLAAGSLATPPALLLAGFDDDTPARTSLFTALETRGCSLHRIALPPPPHPFRATVRAANLHEETRTAARWIRHFLETSAPRLTPRVALIVPGLEQERASLDPILREILAPELESIAADLSSAPYAFSTSAPLSATAMARTALDLLGWATGPLPIDRISTLVLSPYLGTMASLGARATFDAFTLRQSQTLRPELNLDQFARLAARHPAVSSIFAPVAVRAPRLSGPRTVNASYADWTQFARDLLHDAAFPGDRPLNAQEFSDARAWDRALDTVATLDFTGTRVDFATALAALVRQVRSSTAHGSSDSIVQVITPAEAAGSTFDAIVFLRATDANWPTPDRPNPLLGWPLQHDRSMPGTDPALSTARSEAATTNLLASAPTALFFYAAEDENGPQRLSPVISNLALPELPAHALIAPPATTALIDLETVEDLAPLPPLPSTHVRGGARVLQLQAACGFRAFAEIRLSATAPEPASLGLDLRQTGNFVHEVLDRFWREVRTQASLRDLSTTARTAALQSAIDATFSRKLTPETTWDAAYIAVQKDRLRHVLLQWLDRELLRSPFTVTAREQQQHIAVGPLTLQLRMDRVDQVEDGTVLVDYKTGSRSSPRDWEGDRPDDPQLPLYALHPDTRNLQGIVFAKIRPGKDMKWLGYAEDPALIPKAARMEHASLAEQVEAWRTVLVQLAQDFHDGKATVAPKQFPFTCTHCAQRLLCRLDVATMNTEPEEEEAETADAV